MELDVAGARLNASKRHNRLKSAGDVIFKRVPEARRSTNGTDDKRLRNTSVSDVMGFRGRKLASSSVSNAYSLSSSSSLRKRIFKIPTFLNSRTLVSPAVHVL